MGRNISSAYSTMTAADQQLLIELNNGALTYDRFLAQFSVDLKSDDGYFRAEIQAAIASHWATG